MHTHAHNAHHGHHDAHGGANKPGAFGARGRLLSTLALSGSIMIAELIGGLYSHSLALMADAGHMLTDALALLVAFAALTLASKPADQRRTYGYRRLEVLAAFMNGIALVIVSSSIMVEAIERWFHPPSVQAGAMTTVAAIGLAANLIGLWLLGGARGNINIRGAFLHVLGDALSSVGVVVAGIVITVTGWTRADVIVSGLIGVAIVVSSLVLLREVIDVLLESAPRHIDTKHVRASIGAVAGVTEVHDLHIWCITSGLPALSAHVVVADPQHDTSTVLRAIQEQLRHDYDIIHSTLQIERSTVAGCDCKMALPPEIAQ